MWPERLDRFVRQARRRLLARRVALGLAWGSAAALATAPLVVLRVLGGTGGVIAGALVMVVAAAFFAWRAGTRAREVAASIERAAPDFRNLLVTSVELTEQPSRVPPAIREVVWQDALDVADRHDVTRLVPLRRAAVAAVFGVAAWVAALSIAASPRGRIDGIAPAAVTPDDAVITDVRVRMEPPAYSRLPSTTISNPATVEAFAGSRLVLEIAGRAATMVLTDAAGTRRTLEPDAAGVFSGDVIAALDGYLAIEPRSASGVVGARRLVPVTVRPDRLPDVRITAPGKDLFVANTRDGIAVTATADDDLALESLRLTYTKVSGTGETFTFKEGEVPLRLSKRSERAWTGASSLPLPALGLEPGDTLVYRAVAVDSQPGRSPVESDAFIVQVLSPSDVAAEGFATGDDRDRYALSEQMIIVKTQQLHAKRGSMTPEAFAEEALGLAAMQRSVRASFVFMLGGELEDIETEASDVPELHEENEAAGEQDLLAGRMQNRGRQDVLVAIRRMSDAATALVVPDTETALAAERAAVAALQRAFSKSRLILRTFNTREQIDPSRRLTMQDKGEASWRRAAADPTPDPRTAALRQAFDAVAQVGSRAAYGPPERERLTRAAEEILRADPRSTEVAGAASRLTAAADAIAAARASASIGDLVTDAAVDLASLLRAGSVPAARPAPDPPAADLRGAWAERLRAGGGR
jgi:hypothetical protein